MEGSTILGWIGLGSAALAAGALVRSRLQPSGEDPRSNAFVHTLTAIWLSISLTPVQKAFTEDGDLISWILIALRLALLPFIFIQLRRAARAEPSDSKAEL